MGAGEAKLKMGDGAFEHFNSQFRIFNFVGKASD